MYNSDGYVLLDFSKINFTRTNQTIDGIYDRIVNVVGSNKFVIVINANGRTPLPSAVSFVNNTYVLDSVIYSFEITSNDNLKITKKTNVDEIIDDNHSTLYSTYSSSKINSLISSAVSPFAYTEHIRTLTAGQTEITISDDSITTDSIFDFYTSKFGVSPTNCVVTTGSITLTFEVQTNDINVLLRVY